MHEMKGAQKAGKEGREGVHETMKDEMLEGIGEEKEEGNKMAGGMDDEDPP